MRDDLGRRSRFISASGLADAGTAGCDDIVQLLPQNSSSSSRLFIGPALDHAFREFDADHVNPLILDKEKVAALCDRWFSSDPMDGTLPVNIVPPGRSI